MANDSIMARPMKSVRVIDLSASGWRASASSACTMARPIASAGIIAPKAIAAAAATVETSVNHVMSLIFVSSLIGSLAFQRLNSAGDINQREHSKDVGLHQSFHDVQEKNRHRD